MKNTNKSNHLRPVEDALPHGADGLHALERVPDVAGLRVDDAERGHVHGVVVKVLEVEPGSNKIRFLKKKAPAIRK